MGGGSTALVGRAEADNRLTADQGGFIRFALRCLYGSGDGRRIMAICGNNLPTVGFKTLGGIVGKPFRYLTVDRNSVVVVQYNELAQLQGAGQRAHLMGDTFHQAAVSCKHIGVMIDDIMSVTIELRREGFFRNRHANCIGQTLTQRSGSGFYTGCVTELRVTRCG